MKTKCAWIAALWILPLSLAAQTMPVIPLSSEPHHHLVFQNNSVNIYDAKTAPGDSLLLHRHDNDAVAIAIGDQTVTVGIPGKPDVHSKNPDGQLRMQRAGYVHSTHVEGDAPYFTVAIELLHPQTGSRNLCAVVLSGEPLNCPDGLPKKTAGYSDQPQYESDQTKIRLVRVLPRQTVSIGNGTHSELIVALDPSQVSAGSQGKPSQELRPGDYAWFDKGSTAGVFANKGDKEARYIELTFLDSAAPKP
jgi:hypothetical protein